MGGNRHKINFSTKINILVEKPLIWGIQHIYMLPIQMDTEVVTINSIHGYTEVSFEKGEGSPNLHAAYLHLIVF